MKKFQFWQYGTFKSSKKVRCVSDASGFKETALLLKWNLLQSVTDYVYMCTNNAIISNN